MTGTIGRTLARLAKRYAATVMIWAVAAVLLLGLAVEHFVFKPLLGGTSSDAAYVAVTLQIAISLFLGGLGGWLIAFYLQRSPPAALNERE